MLFSFYRETVYTPEISTLRTPLKNVRRTGCTVIYVYDVLHEFCLTAKRRENGTTAIPCRNVQTQLLQPHYAGRMPTIMLRGCPALVPGTRPFGWLPLIRSDGYP